MTVSNALIMPFVQEVGIPQTIITGNAPEEIDGSLGRSVANFKSDRNSQPLPYSPLSILAESTVCKELKQSQDTENSTSFKGTKIILVLLWKNMGLYSPLQG
jgi:hypothetical protein